MQSQNEEDREEHRSQNRDRVRSYRQRKQHGITNIIAQNEPISLVGANNPFNGHMVLDHEQLHTMSNVPISHEYEVIAHKKFRERIDKFAHIQMCHVCDESYPGIQVVTTNTGPMCTRCKKEGSRHRFSSQNHMNPGLQPLVLASLTQIEEMLIARASPILQVMHSIGGQYKYRGHTISFPQEVKDVAKKLPRYIRELDLMIVVQKKGQKGSSYDFTVRKQQVMDALLYKIQHDPYYRDVEVDIHAIDDLPENATDVSDLINSVILPDMDNDMEFATLEGVPGRDDILEGCDTTSFASRPPNAPREIELIRAWANNPNSEVEDPNGKSIDAMNWPTVGSSPINEYNTVGLFDMAFPTLFPKGEADWLQPRMRNVHLHEYAKNLLR